MPAVSPDSLITRTQDLLSTQVDGETVLMDVASGKYFGLARTAQAIWSELETPLTFGALCSRLQARYKGDAAAIAADTQRFLLELSDRQLVTLS